MPTALLYLSNPAGVALARLLGLSLLAPPAYPQREADAKPDAASLPSTDAGLRIAGVVDEIVVVDRLDGRVQRYREVRLADGTTIALQGMVAESLADGVVVDLQRKPIGRSFAVSRTRTERRSRGRRARRGDRGDAGDRAHGQLRAGDAANAGSSSATLSTVVHNSVISATAVRWDSTRWLPPGSPSCPM